MGLTVDHTPSHSRNHVLLPQALHSQRSHSSSPDKKFHEAAVAWGGTGMLHWLLLVTTSLLCPL